MTNVAKDCEGNEHVIKIKSGALGVYKTNDAHYQVMHLPTGKWVGVEWRRLKYAKRAMELYTENDSWEIDVNLTDTERTKRVRELFGIFNKVMGEHHYNILSL